MRIDRDQGIGARALACAVKRRLLASADAEQCKLRDVPARNSEQFFETFSLPSDVLAGLGQLPGEENERIAGSDVGGLFDSEGDASGETAFRAADEGFARTFRQVALGRGELIGAVMRGGESAKYMLLSCLKRTAGKAGSENFRRRKLFQLEMSSRSNLEGSDAGEVIFDRGKADSAIAIALKSVRSARNTLETLKELAKGRGGLPENSGTDTLREIYPFLDDSTEHRDIEAYRALLDKLQDTPENTEKRLVLQRAQYKARAVIEHKARLRDRFLGELTKFAEKAERAEALFDSEDLRREARSAAQAMPAAGETSQEDDENRAEYYGEDDAPNAPDGAPENPPDVPYNLTDCADSARQ
jgi:hypothetical protein